MPCAIPCAAIPCAIPCASACALSAAVRMRFAAAHARAPLLVRTRPDSVVLTPRARCASAPHIRLKSIGGGSWKLGRLAKLHFWLHLLSVCLVSANFIHVKIAGLTLLGKPQVVRNAVLAPIRMPSRMSTPARLPIDSHHNRC